MKNLCSSDVIIA